MNKKGVSIKYGDIAPEAKESFIPTASESAFNTLSQLRQYNLNFYNYANPCELYQTVLDGTAQAFPSVPENANLGLWSEQISNDDGIFKTPINLILTSEGLYSSSGFTFTFDKHNQIYPTHINIHWYRNVEGSETDLGEADFYPDSAIYFCKNRVEYYNKVIIKFTALNMPKNRLKLNVIDYGMGTFFYGDELRNIKIIQEIDPISSEITINTTDFILDVKNDMIYSFQEKQPLTTYFNGKIISTTFVKSAKKRAKFLWDIKSEDYIGLMDSIPYYGGIYTNARAVDVLDDIFKVSKVPYMIDEVFENIKISGYIPYTNCRNALMQVAFAIQAAVDTSNSEVVKVFVLDDEIKQTIPLNRIMQGQNFDDEETITGVEVVLHTYKPTAETVDAYDANQSGTGQNIFVKFNEPLHNLSITNGEIVSHGTNYAVINANENCVLTGQKYEHTTQTRRKNNSVILANEIEKIISIGDATLVSVSNIDNVLEKCYNWITKTNIINLKIIEGKHISYGNSISYGTYKYGTFNYGEREKIIIYDKETRAGENISCETEYLGILSGRIIKQSFNLNGGILIKDTQIR